MRPFEHHVVELDYEFDAPRWHDFTREETPMEAAAAQMWFQPFDSDDDLGRQLEEESLLPEADSNAACLALAPCRIRWPAWMRVHVAAFSFYSYFLGPSREDDVDILEPTSDDGDDESSMSSERQGCDRWDRLKSHTWP